MILTIKERRAAINSYRLRIGKIYSISNKCSKICYCCPTYTGVFLRFTHPRYAEFRLVYPASGIISIRIDEPSFLFKEVEGPMSPTLAKQYARGLCEYIPEDCAGIIERFLIGSMAGYGASRYPVRSKDSN
jgi:hypothetical protein